MAAAQAVLLGAVVWFVFSADVRQAPQFVYLLFVPVVWLALTWGVVGATLGTLLLQLGLLMGARGGVAASRRIELRHGVADAVTVRADPIQLQMVLHNLVTNAFEALESRSRAGWIRIAFDGGERPTLRLSDSGPGLAPEVARALFQPFVTDKAEGMGLGLALSRSLMRSQGGDLRLLSSGVGGTNVVVEMPPAAGARIAA